MSTFKYVQVACCGDPLDRVEVLEDWIEWNVMKVLDNGSSHWVFREDCVGWRQGSTSLLGTATYLSEINALRKEGVYCYDLRCWKRIFLTKERISIKLIEEVPESGGQRCIWTAGLVMAKYLEYVPIRHHENNTRLRILELGAGAGLTAMVAALYGGDVYATEQESCLEYLQRNIDLNPSIHPNIHIKSLHWNSNLKTIKFDIILGCDITYDFHNFQSIFSLFKQHLCTNGFVLLCHDNDSCPLSDKSHRILIDVAAQLGFHIEDVNYEDSIPDSFCNKFVKMWKLIIVNETEKEI